MRSNVIGSLPRLLALLSLAMLHIGCSGDRKGVTSPTPEVPTRTLRVHAGHGVSGTPAGGESTHRDGTTINYAFQAGPGHENLTVMLDGAAVAASGSFPMGGDRQLVATADITVHANPADSTILRVARSVATAPDPAAAYSDLMARIGTLYQQVGPAEASRRLEAVSASFSLSDVQTYTDAQARLANRIFDVDGVGLGTQATHARSVGEAQAVSTRPLRVIYVNGLLTGFHDAAANTWLIRGAAKEAGFRFGEPGAPYGTLHFYNASSRFLPDGQKRNCTLWAAAQAERTGILGWARLLDNCAIRDWLEAGTQLLDVLKVLPTGADGDARQLAELIDTQISSNGNRVILVLHSQGNLMAQQAVRTLVSTNPSRGACIGVVSLAAPTNKGWESTAAFNELVVGGSTLQDMILLLGQNSATPLRTELSDSLENAYAATASFSWPPRPWIKVVSEIHLHSLTKSYVGAPASRQWLVSALRSQDTRLASTCPADQRTLTIIPSVASIPVGGELSLSVELKDDSGNIIQPPQVTWETSASGIATVSSSGVVRAIGEGEVRITARVGTLTAESIITVRPRTVAPQLIWKFQEQTANPRIAGVALGPSGTVYTLTGNGGAENRNLGALYALDPADGRQLWRLAGWEYTREGPVVGDDGTIYFTGTGGFGFAEFIAAVSPSTGTVRWVKGGSFSEIGYFGAPVVGPSGIIVAPGRDATWAFDASTGNRRWARSASGWAGAPAVTEGGVLYVGSVDSTMTALRVTTGETLWTRKLGHMPYGPISLTANELISGTTTSVLVALDRTTGAVRWQRTYPSPSAIESTVTIGPDNILYLSSGHGRLAAIDPATGGELWSRTDGQVLWPATIAADGTVLVSFVDHPSYEVHAIQGSTGTTLWKWADHRIAGVLLPRTSGRAYVFGDWSVSALAVELPGLATSSWPMLQRDPARSSRAP